MIPDKPSDPAAAAASGAGDASDNLTQMLQRASSGEPAAELLPLVYDQLRRIAQQRMNAERPGHTLTATALVHEVYAKLVGGAGSGGNAAVGDAGSPRRWNGRSHFLLAAAEAMRRILVDHARAKKAGAAEHRGAASGGEGLPRRPLRMPSNVLDLAEDQDPESILALDDAMTRLMHVDANAAMVVRLRFFAGRTVDETAAALGISPRQVDREWVFARAWLSDALGGPGAPSNAPAGSGPPKPARPS